jgi:YggT family protein
MYIVAEIIHRIFQLLTLVIIIDVILSYFMSPFHPIRYRLDKLIEPMLAPIRRILPATGSVDFSPVVLVIIIQIADAIITGIIRSM